MFRSFAQSLGLEMLSLPMAALMLFLAVFAFAVVRALRMRREDGEALASLPLDLKEEPRVK